MNKALHRIMVNELSRMDYYELCKIFGSIGADEIHAEAHKLHIEDVCKELQITKAEYKKNPDMYEEDFALRLLEA